MKEEKTLKKLELKPAGFTLDGKVVHNVIPIKLTYIQFDVHYTAESQEEKLLQKFNPEDREEEEIDGYVLGNPFRRGIEEGVHKSDVYPVLYLKIISDDD